MSAQLDDLTSEVKLIIIVEQMQTNWNASSAGLPIHYSSSTRHAYLATKLKSMTVEKYPSFSEQIIIINYSDIYLITL